LVECPVKPGNDSDLGGDLNQPELGAGVQEFPRIDRLAVDAGLIV
jgi:hypothetical protein